MRSRRLLAIAVVGVVIFLVARDGKSASTPYLLKDINNAPTTPVGSYPRRFATVGSSTYFVAVSEDGATLWRTDGTTDTTVPIKVFYPSQPNGPTNLVATTTRLVFVAQDPNGPIELWTSDGTGSGTRPIVEMERDRPGPGSLDPSVPVAVSNDTVYYRGGGDEAGEELWKTDGLTLSRVADINAGAASSYPTQLTDSGGTLFFVANDDTHGAQLWKTNGTEASTARVTDFPTTSAFISNLTSAGSLLFFTASSADTGNELWVTDGTIPGTRLVKDIFAGSGSAAPSTLLKVGSLLFFAANDGLSGVQLWRSDGTDGGTIKLTSAGPSGNSSVGTMGAAGGLCVFAATDDSSDPSVWASDGTVQGTRFISTVHGSSNTAVLGSILYFAGDASAAAPLWRTDGTEAGTYVVSTVQPDTYVNHLYAAGGFLLFPGKDGLHGSELWKTDGTSEGTQMLRNIAPDTSSEEGDGVGWAHVGGLTYFVANDGIHGGELWRTDGTSDGTRLVVDIAIGAASSHIQSLISLNGKLYFSATDADHGAELWMSDGTESGTHLVKDIVAGPNSSGPGLLVRMGDVLYFVTTQGFYPQLWRSDGTEAGTTLVHTFAYYANPYIVVAGDRLYFSDYITGVAFASLFVSNGTPEGTHPVAGGEGKSPETLTAVGSVLFYTTYSTANGHGLWKTDGTAAGTVLLKGGSSDPGHWLTDVDGVLMFVSNTALWRSDGTPAGTYMVRDINPYVAYPGNLTAVHGALYFLLTPLSSFDTQLWKSDGTAGGTVFVAHVGYALDGFGRFAVGVAGASVFFSSFDSQHGWELWESDGTDQGTVVYDIDTGPESSSPHQLSFSDSGILYFRATTPDEGNEPRALSLLPVIDSFSPNTGTFLGGTSVTMNGSRLNGASVRLGSTPATIMASNDSSIQVVTPRHAVGVVDASVTTLTGAASLPDAFTYFEPAFHEPYDLVAAATANDKIQLNWLPGNGVDHYEVARRSKTTGGLYPTIAPNVVGTSFVDDVSGGESYAYEVRGVAADASTTSYTPPDVATAIIFSRDPLGSGATMNLDDLKQLRDAASAIAALAGTDAVLAPLATPQPVNAGDIVDLRHAINDARNALAVGVLIWIDPALSGGVTPIRASHIQQLRDAVK
jgi:ELWxxDGT repeat protein